jgi:hypothetical protein
VLKRLTLRGNDNSREHFYLSWTRKEKRDTIM